MYVNSSLTAQRIHICTGLRFFWIRDSHSPQPLVERKIQSGNLCSALKFRWIPKDADLCLSLKFFSGEEAGTLSGFTAPSVVNSVLLKCRKLRREDQETSDWIVSRMLYSMTCHWYL